MAWNQSEYDRGVNDALAVAAENGNPDQLIDAYKLLTNVGEYEVGFARGVTRHLIDTGAHVKCARFIVGRELRVAIGEFIDGLVDDGKARWALDPEHYAVVGLLEPDGKCLMVVYLEEGDTEESTRFLEMADEAEAVTNVEEYEGEWML